ncbi:Vmc-like lipoprotein signal peptide domain-containing protein [Mycoplasma mycoides]|uniref:Vmc-like lipoprotein signal peptide domain-containing protein n=1 Tax=Mycoplasma mycoides TaxID=2102 RepID=UPI0027338983|nr:lipoprotein [Mycoplasma mycoides]MDP4040263.1 lipoprotein [Mycoplasma mycoides]MDP4041129.1 lipoprotein [Mycoplasma mycoides]MDP4042081.1 lipoprotein [Mycoplasma mycoides]MDP4043483.1 lipoprotein [Mycoplasma mycoides]MDP4044330.1 lipoprotein [Mycoplasma mycoides]
MKKLLTVLGSLMIGTSSAALVVACNNTNPSQPANKDKDENPSNSGGSEKPGKTDDDKKPDGEKNPTNKYDPRTYTDNIFNRSFMSGVPSKWVGTIHNSSFVNGTPAVGSNGETNPKNPTNTLTWDRVYYDSATGHDVARTYSDKRDAEEEAKRKHNAEISSNLTKLLFDDFLSMAKYEYNKAQLHYQTTIAHAASSTERLFDNTIADAMEAYKDKLEKTRRDNEIINNSNSVHNRANWSGVSEEGRRAAEEASDWVTENSDWLNNRNNSASN